MNGFDSHSFHQNCLSTRRQRGRVGYSSLDALTLSILCVMDCGLLGRVVSGKASNSASSASSFRDLESRSCLCCKDRVMSEEMRIKRKNLERIELTECIGEVHFALRERPDTFPDYFRF